MLNLNTNLKSALYQGIFVPVPLVILILFMSHSLASAQNGNGLVIPSDDYDQAIVGNLDRTIEGDTLADGSRAHDYYILERDGEYWLESTIQNDGWHLHLVAEDGEGHPPIVRPAVDLTGESRTIFNINGDVTIDGIYFSNMDDQGSINRRMFRIIASDSRFVFNNIWAEYDSQAFFRTDGDNNVIIITNSMLRNSGPSDSGGNGRIFDLRGNPSDSLIMENNTVYNIQYAALRSQRANVKYVRLNHNTFVDVGFDWHFWEFNEVHFTNNQVINNGYRGISPTTEMNGEPIVPSIMSTTGVFLIDSMSEVPDEERIIRFANNNFQFSWDEMTVDDHVFYDDITLHRPLYGPMEAPVQSVFDNNEDRMNVALFDSVGWDWVTRGLIEFENNITDDDGTLQWTDRSDINVVAEFSRYLVEEDDPDNIPILYDRYPADGNWLVTGLDMWRDFSYATTAPSYTSAENGYPIGDLNWFPDKKARWEVGDVLTSSEIEPAIPTRTAIVGNYPNPFNPTSQLVFNLSSKERVGFEIYNTLGQMVQVIEPMAYNAGRHEVTIDGAHLSSGIYLVRMLTDGQVNATHKITLIK